MFFWTLSSKWSLRDKHPGHPSEAHVLSLPRLTRVARTASVANNLVCCMDENRQLQVLKHHGIGISSLPSTIPPQAWQERDIRSGFDCTAPLISGTLDAFYRILDDDFGLESLGFMILSPRIERMFQQLFFVSLEASAASTRCTKRNLDSGTCPSFCKGWTFCASSRYNTRLAGTVHCKLQQLLCRSSDLSFVARVSMSFSLVSQVPQWMPQPQRFQIVLDIGSKTFAHESNGKTPCWCIII